MQRVTPTEPATFENQLSQTFKFGQLSPEEKEFSLRAAMAIQKLVKDMRLACAAFNSHGRDGLKDRKLG